MTPAKRKLIPKLSRWAGRLVPEGPASVRLMGHRNYVGGQWDAIGKLQFDFTVQQGLEPSHCLLDIGCGALRGGVRFIRYLDPGNYLGMDKEQTLIDAGVARELGPDLAAEKRPEFVVSSAFEFERFSKTPAYSIAQSLFTHLTEADIRRCLGALRANVEPGHVCLATFFEDDERAEPEQSHSFSLSVFPREAILAMGRDAGFAPAYIGDWGHPRGQVMVRYVAE